MRYLVNISYDGSNYYGWSKQKHEITIQDHLEKILSKIFKEKISIHCSGRTDKGVHALNQYFHFDSNMKIDTEKLVFILNKSINEDLYIKKIKLVDEDFHSRYSIKNKTYLYVINTSKKNPFMCSKELQYNKEIDLDKLQEILNTFLGKHDFLSFSTSILKNTTREIYWIKVTKNSDKVKIKINGDGFLRYMVRMIVSYSLLVLEGKKDINSIKNLLLNPLKGSSIHKANPCGLYLYNVYY
ncbi:MAG: tRNA pseudouridine(38-40) synthase TruA [Mycoplasmoidaceae bacterium]